MLDANVSDHSLGLLSWERILTHKAGVHFSAQADTAVTKLLTGTSSWLV